MENHNIKCSTQNHANQNASKYCSECNINMCNKCLEAHLILFNNHHLLDLSGDITKLFNGFCKEENHSNRLEYFCKTHNQLCCLSCIGKDENHESSKHKNCKICFIYDIKDNKKNNLDKSIKILEDLSNNINEIIDKSKGLIKKFNEDKEKLKYKIQLIITNLRNKINEREDEILSALDSEFNKLYPSEKEMKDFEKIPKKIENILSKKEDIDKKLNDSFLLNSYINDCLNIENEFKEINEKVDSLNKYNHNSKIKIYFFPEEKDMNKIYDNIKSFGKIYQNETEVKSFFLSKEEKENKNLNDKIDKLKNEFKSNKYNLQRQLDDVKNQLKHSKICFTMRSRCALHKCLDVNDMSYGNSPHLWDYIHNNNNQIFELENNFDGTYSIKCSASGLYLGIDADRIAFRRRNENAQSFYLNHFDDGYYLFQEKGGGIIDLTDFHTHNGANIGKCHRNNSAAQQWKLVAHL